MKKGQKIKYKDKYYFIKAVIRQGKERFVLIQNFDKTHSVINVEEKEINFLKLTYRTDESYKKGTKKVVLRYLEPNTYKVKFDVLGNQLGLLDIVPSDFD